MVQKNILSPSGEKEISYCCKVYTYPDGSQDLVAAAKPIFRESGWEERQKPQEGNKVPRIVQVILDVLRSAAHGELPTEEEEAEAEKENQRRSMRRARARVRRLALANDFRWFVTLTLNAERVDRYDMAQIVRKLNAWCSNMVQRHGLCYILVPERHKDGAIHFHGFFNDCLQAVDSGHKDSGGHAVFNLPQWDLGFTTAIELYDDYHKAVSYVCKYIGKQGEKPAGRWYYSGGGLREPKTDLADISAADILEEYDGRAWCIEIPGGIIAGVNGVKSE